MAVEKLNLKYYYFYYISYFIKAWTFDYTSGTISWQIVDLVQTKFSTKSKHLGRILAILIHFVLFSYISISNVSFILLSNPVCKNIDEIDQYRSRQGVMKTFLVRLFIVTWEVLHVSFQRFFLRNYFFVYMRWCFDHPITIGATYSF